MARSIPNETTSVLSEIAAQSLDAIPYADWGMMDNSLPYFEPEDAIYTWELCPLSSGEWLVIRFF